MTCRSRSGTTCANKVVTVREEELQSLIRLERLLPGVLRGQVGEQYHQKLELGGLSAGCIQLQSFF